MDRALQSTCYGTTSRVLLRSFFAISWHPVIRRFLLNATVGGRGTPLKRTASPWNENQDEGS
jgi:hypothetical protein